MSPLKALIPIILLALVAMKPAVPANCVIEGAAAAQSDVLRARAACETARARFAELFGNPVPAVRVVLHEQPGYRVAVERGRTVLYWPNSAAMVARAGSSAAAQRHSAAQWREVLPHETMHALMAAHFYGAGGVPAHDGYGTPLPDWFEEAVAIWAEPLDSRQRRLAYARALPAHRRELHAILSRPHPAAADGGLLAARDGAPLPADAALWAFYPQAIAVLTFVHDAGGAAAVTELARRLLADPNDLHALAALPGLPRQLDGVHAAWQTWLSPAANAAFDQDGQGR